MKPLQQAIEDFLGQRRLAVAGVSRNPQEAANVIYRRLRGAGYEVYAVNPHADEVEGDRCYPDLASVPVRPDGVVAVTPPEGTEAVVHACAEVGIPRVWMHRGIGPGSISEAAVAFGREHGIEVIAGGCPMWYCEPVDFGHRCIRGVSRLAGRLPQTA